MKLLLKYTPLIWLNYAILHVYSIYYQKVSFVSAILTSLILSLILVLVIFILSKVIINDKVPIYASFFLIWFFAYEPTRVCFYFLTGSHLHENKYFMFIWVFVFLIIWTIIYKINNYYEKITRYLLITGCIAVGIGLINFVWNVSHEGFDQEPGVIDKISEQSPNINSLPNIFYIILDEYPSSKELKDSLGFDNHDFMKFLTDKGFFVASDSHCNYPNTETSVSSSLNMEYFQADKYSDNPKEIRVKFLRPLKEMINNNNVSLFLKTQGYTFTSLQDYHVRDGIIFQNNGCVILLYNLLKLSLFRRIVVENYLEGMDKRKYVMNQLDSLEKLAKSGGHKMVYAHIMLPHWPYVFNKDGGYVPFFQRFYQTPSNKKLFLDQITYTNKIIQGALEKIINASKIPPIIIIQGDHGPQAFYRVDQKMLNLRMSILNAYYVPDIVKKRLYSSISPVNSFRLILSAYFHGDFPLLPAKHYVSFYPSHEMTDVTEELSSPTPSHN